MCQIFVHRTRCKQRIKWQNIIHVCVGGGGSKSWKYTLYCQESRMIVKKYKILSNDRVFFYLQSYHNTGCWSFFYIDPGTVHSLHSFEMCVSNVLPVETREGHTTPHILPLSSSSNKLLFSSPANLRLFSKNQFFWAQHWTAWSSFFA